MKLKVDLNQLSIKLPLSTYISISYSCILFNNCFSLYKPSFANLYTLVPKQHLLGLFQDLLQLGGLGQFGKLLINCRHDASQAIRANH